MSTIPAAGLAEALEGGTVAAPKPAPQTQYAPDGWLRGLHKRAGFSDTPFSGKAYWQESIDFYKNDKVKLKNEILSGLTVAIAQVPESVAFSFVAGVNPLVGLYATFFLGLITALIGGRPGMVSGAAGAMAVVARIVMQKDGLFLESKLLERGEIVPCLSTVPGCLALRVQADNKRTEYLFFVMWVVGILQIALGVFQFGRLVKLIPQTVMTGFVNGLATIIFMAQLESFQELDWKTSFDYFDANRDGFLTFNETFARFALDLPTISVADLTLEMNQIFHGQADINKDGFITQSEFQHDASFAIHDGHDENKMWRTLEQSSLWVMLFYVFGSMCIVHFFPRIPRIGKMVPSSLISIISCLVLEHAVFRQISDELKTPTVADIASVAGGLPVFHVPDIKLDSEAWGIAIPTCISLALVGIIESVLTLQLVDEIMEDISDSTGRCTQECLAQGISNLVSAMFQSMGGDAMIGQSTINVKSGGTGRLSTSFAAVMFLIFILALSSVIELLPIAALTGVLFMVVIYTFDWSCLGLMSGVELRLGRAGTPEAKAAAAAARSRIQCTGGRSRWQDSFLIIMVTLVTVLTNLAYAVILGVITAALLHAWDTSTHIDVKTSLSANGATKTYTVTGPLFFASDRAFKNYFATKADPPNIIVDCTGAVLYDYSAIAALGSLGQRYADLNKQCTIKIQGEVSSKLVKLMGRHLQNVKVEEVDAPQNVKVEEVDADGCRDAIALDGEKKVFPDPATAAAAKAADDDDKAAAAAARDPIVSIPAGPTHDQRKASIDRYNSKQKRREGGE
jgi:SulP family sulfate permease